MQGHHRNAASGALFKAGPGDTIFVDGGTQTEASIPLDGGKSLVYQEFNDPDGPAVIDGGALYPAISISSFSSGGTVEGLTLRSSLGAVVTESDLTLRNNVIDGDVDVDAGSNDGSVNLYGSGTDEFVLIDNTFTDPTVTDGQFGIQARLGGTSTATIQGNSFNGYWRAIDMAGDAPSSYSSGTQVIDDNTFTGMHQIPDPMDPMNFIPGIALFVEGVSFDLTDNLARSPGVGFTFGYSGFAGGSVTSARNEAYNLDVGFDFNDAPLLSMNGDIAAHNSLYGISSRDNNGPPSRGISTPAT